MSKHVKEKVISKTEYIQYYGLDTKLNGIHNLGYYYGIQLHGAVTIYIKNGEWHRIGGPARVWDSNYKEYWLFGRLVTKEHHDFFVGLLKLKDILIY